MNPVYDTIIIGGGPGGYTAALYAARAGLKVLVLEKLSAGGQMALTSQIDNYPGFPEGIDGYTLGERMQAGAERFGAVTEIAEVFRLDLQSQPKVAHTSEGDFYGKTIIFSTGASPRELGIPGERELIGRGVNYCAHCDGMFYKGKTVVVVVGGNSAVADALYLSRIAAKVIVIHRRDTLRATKVYHDQFLQASNIEFLWNSAVRGLLREEKLTGVLVQNLITAEETQLPCDGLFVSIGRKPATALAEEQLTLDENGYIIADESTQTSLPGVFAVGDVRTKALRQIVTAVADGAMAAHGVETYLQACE